MLSLAVLVSFVGAFLQQRSRAGQISLTSYFGWFSLIFLVQLPLVILYNLVLHPLYLSPFRKLPPAPVSSIYGFNVSRCSDIPSQQPKPWKRLLYEPTGDDCLEWTHTIQNDGLIRYFGAFNSQRILITSPQGLHELLQSKSYLFVKSPGVRRLLVMLLGNGLVVSEGAEHKVSKPGFVPVNLF